MTSAYIKAWAVWAIPALCLCPVEPVLESALRRLVKALAKLIAYYFK